MIKKILLTKGKKALVDKEDYDKLNQFNWYALNGTYAARCLPRDENGKQKLELMHRVIMNYPNKRIDHINGNGLDNRKENLRLVTHSQNIINSKKRKNCSSKYKGVSWDKRCKKWSAYIRVNQKHINLGKFNIEKDAAQAYNKAANKYFKQYARLNEV